MGEIAQIHYILQKITYCQNFLISFNRLLYYKYSRKFLFKPRYGKSPFKHINMKMKIGKPCCHLQNHNYEGWRRGGGIW